MPKLISSKLLPFNKKQSGGCLSNLLMPAGINAFLSTGALLAGSQYAKNKVYGSKKTSAKKTIKRRKSTQKGGNLLSLIMPTGLNPALATAGLVGLTKIMKDKTDVHSSIKSKVGASKSKRGKSSIKSKVGASKSKRGKSSIKSKVGASKSKRGKSLIKSKVGASKSKRGKSSVKSKVSASKSKRGKSSIKSKVGASKSKRGKSSVKKTKIEQNKKKLLANLNKLMK